jgi:hypothetical protein
VVALGVVMLCLALAGCVSDPAPRHASLSLIEAHEAASAMVKAKAGSTSLAGFVASEGLEPVPAARWLVDTAGAHSPAGASLSQGYAASWVLLYATMDGRVLRAVVDEDLQVRTDWAIRDPDPVARSLWGMNLGGRLLVDSDQAVAAALKEPSLAEHAEANPDVAVAIASSVAEVKNGRPDMVYAVYWGPPQEGLPFSRFAYVHHFTGDLVRWGDAGSYLQEKRVVLLDESFTLGPVPSQVEQSQGLGVQVEDAILRLTTSGVGEYTVRVLHEGVDEIAAVEGLALVQEETQEVPLGTLRAGEYTLQVEVTGRVGFHLVVEGVVPADPTRPF